MSFGRQAVTYLIAAIGGLIGAVLLWLSTAFVADFLLGLSGMSAREGGRAMMAFFAIGPFGALVGLGLGIWLALRQRGAGRSLSAFLGALLTAVLLVAGTYGAVIGYYKLTDDDSGSERTPAAALFRVPAPRGHGIARQARCRPGRHRHGQEPDVRNPHRDLGRRRQAGDPRRRRALFPHIEPNASASHPK
jgi:MFS family permease